MIFKKNKQIHVAWTGIGNPQAGYGHSNRMLLNAIAGTSVTAHALDDALAESCTVGIAYDALCNAPLERIPSPYRILYTMFEADRWPVDWVSACNCANQVWVPSTFCKETLLASGCESPVEIVPLGVDTDVYYSESKGGESETFTIGFAGAASMRKGFDLAVQAFTEEFGADEPVRFAVRSAHLLDLTVPKDPRIQVIGGVVSDDDMRAFYNSIDLLVLPTRGEGFGLTPLEAMACGTPVAVTNWSGCTDYLADDTLRIAVDRLESCKGYHGVDARWASPSMASIRYCMRWAYETRETAREMGLTASERVRKDWAYAKSALAIEKLLTKVNSKERVQIQSKNVVVWHGNPRSITTKAGGFVRGVPRELTDKQLSAMDFSDVRFRIEKRYFRL